MWVPAVDDVIVVTDIVVVYPARWRNPHFPAAPFFAPSPLPTSSILRCTSSFAKILVWFSSAYFSFLTLARIRDRVSLSRMMRSIVCLPHYPVSVLSLRCWHSSPATPILPNTGSSFSASGQALYSASSSDSLSTTTFVSFIFLPRISKNRCWLAIISACLSISPCSSTNFFGKAVWRGHR